MANKTNSKKCICVHFKNSYCQDDLEYTHILVPEKEGAGVTGIASMPRRYSNIGDTNTNLRVSEYPKQFGEEGNTH